MTMVGAITTSDESKQKVRKLFKIESQQQVDEIIENLRVFVKNNRYPEELQDKHFLEQFLLHAKFDEQTCEKNLTTFVSHACTYHKLLESLVGPFELRKEQGIVVTSLTLTSNLERIILIRMSPQNVTDHNLDVERIVQVLMTCAVLHFHVDYSASVRFILDFNQVKMAHCKNLKFSHLNTLKGMHEYIIKERIAGVEIIHAPNVLNYVLGLIKMAVPAKIFNRVKSHENLDSLYKHVEREYLPIEYGGTQWPLDLMIDEWDKAIREHQAVLQRMAQLTKKMCLEEQTKEVEPSFRYLAID